MQQIVCCPLLILHETSKNMWNNPFFSSNVQLHETSHLNNKFVQPYHVTELSKFD